MIGELTVAFAWLADRAPLRALIVTGAGKAFCAGGDVNWFQQGRRGRGDRPALRGAARRRGAAPGDRRPAPDPLPGDRRGQRPGRRRRLLAGARLRHPDRLRERLLRLRLRPHRRLPGRRHDLLPAPRRRPQPGAGAAARRPQHDAPQRRSTSGLVTEVVAARGADGRAPAAKAEKLAAKAPHYVRMAKQLCAAEHREQPHRAPAAGAPRDRRQHGHRGPAQRRRGLLRRREARVQGR